MEPHSVELCESLFFTARTVTLPLASSSCGYSKRIHDEMNPESDSSSSSSPASSSGYSTRIHDLMKLKSESGMSKEDAEIEASKSHWTDTTYYTASMSGSTEMDKDLLEAQKLYKENVEVMRSLQREDVNGRFFEIGWKVLGRKIAEGGQATIYDGGLKRYVGLDGEEGEMVLTVLKVFKARYPLSHLQKQWPLAFLLTHNFISLLENEETSAFLPIWCGRLLEDGRFGFEMIRLWGDLRKLLDARLVENGNQHPPLMKLDGHYHECCILHMMGYIAEGMERLHKEDTLHRDLKASNVLIDSVDFPTSILNSEEGGFDPLELTHDIICIVTDYECSIGVVDTGFWRAPEILEALKNQKLHTAPNVFGPKADVYSYAMTCYEILTGLIPFEHPKDHGTRIEDVIEGKRPTLPKHLKPWVEELFHKCWHANPSKKPSFEEIVTTLEEIEDIGIEYHINSRYFEKHGFD